MGRTEELIEKRRKDIASLETFSSENANYNISLQNVRKLYKELEAYIQEEAGKRLVELKSESRVLHLGTFSPHLVAGEDYPYCDILSVPSRIVRNGETGLYCFDLAALVLDNREDSDGFRFVIKEGSELLYDPAKLYDLGEEYGTRMK